MTGAEEEAGARLTAALRALGVGEGAVVYLGADMGGLALPRWPAPRSREAMAARREAACAFVHDGVRAAIGPAGTILAPAFSYDYARRGTPYIHETTPSEVGPFTEWLRTRPATIRSLHPLFSVCGLGPRASAILDEVGPSAFGANSPFGRLAAHDTVFVGLGLPLAAWFTHAHHLEQVAGVNHAYHKLFTVPVRRGGAEVPGPFLAFLRYLGSGVELAIERLEAGLRAAGVLRESRDEAGLLQAVTAADAERVGLAMLRADPGAFTRAPVEIHIEAPGAFRQPPGRARAVRFMLEG